jgi:hypothetical protein
MSCRLSFGWQTSILQQEIIPFGIGDQRIAFLLS